MIDDHNEFNKLSKLELGVLMLLQNHVPSDDIDTDNRIDHYIKVTKKVLAKTSQEQHKDRKNRIQGKEDSNKS